MGRARRSATPAAGAPARAQQGHAFLPRRRERHSQLPRGALLHAVLLLGFVVYPASAATTSPTPSRAASEFVRGNVIAVRVGDASYPASTGATALSVYLDEFDPSSGVGMPSSTTAAPCALGTGDPIPGGSQYIAFDTEGLPSNSEDGTLLLLPCYDTAANGVGSPLQDSDTATLRDILVLAADGSTSITTTTYFPHDQGYGVDVVAFHQVASVSGATFYGESSVGARAQAE